MSRSHLRKMQTSMLQVAGLEHKANELLCTSEREFVFTALEEMMTSAVRENWQTSVDQNLNLRDTCYQYAINSVYGSHVENGIMSTPEPLLVSKTDYLPM